MSDAEREKEFRDADPAAALNRSNSSEPVATDDLPLDSNEDPEKQSSQRPTVSRYTTNASGKTTDAESAFTADEAPKKRTFWQKINPMKRNQVIPVPKEKTVSPEGSTGIFSTYTFNWIAPLMAVSSIFKLTICTATNSPT
jgi:ATP-binding cassette, subfamily C (CFTR/MRP), member 1